MNEKINSEINDVTDTALWIAAYRAEETQRRDALFRDPFAKILLGSTGHSIATRTQGSRYTAWSVVIRTYIIDHFIIDLISKNPSLDTVINLGAGLDTRPYRLSLPKNLRWVEVDFPKIIDLKNDKLNSVAPLCKLERHSLDLSDNKVRDYFLEKISNESNSVLTLTEGVIPYLSNQNAQSLAQSLYRQKNFLYWITEYYSPEILEFLRTPKRLKQMQKSPFLFYPEKWFEFFKIHGWEEFSTKYFGEESEKIGRTPPTPGWIKRQEENQSDTTIKSSKNDVKFFLGYSIYKRC